MAGSTGLEPAASGVTASVPHALTCSDFDTYIAEEKLGWQATLPEDSSLLLGWPAFR